MSEQYGRPRSVRNVTGSPRIVAFVGLGLSLALCSTAAAVSGGGIQGQITSVTVYPDRAQVTREVEVDVSADRSSLVVRGLPTSLDPDSLRIRAQGPDGMLVGSIETRLVRGSERTNPDVQALEDRIEDLQDNRQALQYQIDALDLRISLARSLADGASEGGLQPEMWPEAFDLIGEGVGRAYGERHEIEIERRKLDDELERLNQQLSDLAGEQKDSLDAVIGYQSPDGGLARLELDYLVPDASWAPRYRMEIDTDARTMSLTQQARVRQGSDEDWTDVSLRLSTSRPALGGSLPEVQPWYIDIRRLHPEVRGHADAPVMEMARSPSLQDHQSEQMMASVEGTAYVTEYLVPGKATVPADQSDHQFTLDQHDLDVSLTARAVPRVQDFAFLNAEGVYQGNVPLLAGMAALVQDGNLVGHGRLEDLAPGESISQAFGIDPRIEITHSTVSDERGTQGIVRSRNTQERRHIIEVTNRHEDSVDIALQDRVPVPRDERIEVTLTDETDLPDEQDVNDQPGVVEWRLALDPGETRRLIFGFIVTWPEEDEIGGL